MEQQRQEGFEFIPLLEEKKHFPGFYSKASGERFFKWYGPHCMITL